MRIIAQPWSSFVLVLLIDAGHRVAALVGPSAAYNHHDQTGCWSQAPTTTTTTTTTALLFAKRNKEEEEEVACGSSRREALSVTWRGLGSAAAALLVAPQQQPQPANAFVNKISTQYDDRPKRRGPQPQDLSLRPRMTMSGEDYIGLKSCGAAPNCFSSTITLEDDPDHSIPAWVWPMSVGDQEKAFDELKQVILAYEPGQKGVDGGGFELKTFDPIKGYMYVQFESLKNGYIDDVEFAVLPPGEGASAGPPREVQVRSSSRIGYLDFGVNAKRLNAIAKALRGKGWTAVGVDPQTHEFYVSENSGR
jgi:uncharacterized protein (DUF1499 family)